MRRAILALTVALVLLLTWGVGSALADSSSPPVQATGQSADSSQQAVGASTAAQAEPSNSNVSVRVLSPGDDGPVSQSNNVSSTASATNSNTANQDGSQTQLGGDCRCVSGSGIQALDQSAGNQQTAAALSSAVQVAPSNDNTSVRVLSPGSNGPVAQSNNATSSADAENTNAADQTGSQSQSGGGSGVQAATQASGNEQEAAAKSDAVQVKPENSNISVRVLSPGNNGPVTQSNTASSDAKAANTNSATQDATQSQSGPGCGCTGAAGTQFVGQSAENDQKAGALSAALQFGASNTNSSVRVASPGNDGPVTQSNNVSSTADASNSNSAKQSGTQTSTGSGPAGTQAVIQGASNEQEAGALSAAIQKGASNDNSPVRIASPGNGGSVNQSNNVTSSADASNHNDASQTASQTASGNGCKCGSGSGTQAIFQGDESSQKAVAASLAVQIGKHDECGCGSSGNSSAPVRIASPGNDGPLTQSNDVSSHASANNRNSSAQTGTQASGGSSPIQVIAQSDVSHQAALGLSAAIQKGASNDYSPVRIWSPGNGGAVTQSNNASSTANASNGNSSEQIASQTALGSRECCKGGAIQALGQEALNGQHAFAASLALQEPGAKRTERCGCSSDGNSFSPVRIKSAGNDGPLSQSNTATSYGTADNRNSAIQSGTQTAFSFCGCLRSRSPIQALGQHSGNWQGAAGLSAALQKGAANDSDPLRIQSSGGLGSLSQANSAGSTGKGSNGNSSVQHGSQFIAV